MKTIVAAALVAALICGLPVHAEEARWREGFDEWYEVFLGGRKAGYMHQRLEDGQFEGGGVQRMTQELSTTFMQEGSPVESTTVVETVSSGDVMRPLAFVKKELDGGTSRTYTGIVKPGGTLMLESKIGGRVNLRSVVVPEGAIYSVMFEKLVRGGIRDGKPLKVPVLMEGDGDVVNATAEFGAAGDGAPCNGAISVTKTQVAGVSSEEWRDRQGRPLCISVPSMKALFVLSDKGRATAGFNAFDLMAQSLIKPDRLIDKPSKLSSVLLRMVFDGPVPVIPEDSLQQVVAKDAGSLTLSILRDEGKIDEKRPLVLNDPTLKVYLAPTEYEQSDNPEIAGKSSELVWAIDDAGEAVTRIVHWVHEHVRHPSQRRGSLSALEVLRSGDGDCTEYAVLFTALARAAGIPARLVAGLVYSEGTFGFHEWAEVWVGRWIPVDPTFDQVPADPTHIKLWAGTGEPREIRQASVAASALVGRIKLEVLKTETAR